MKLKELLTNSQTMSESKMNRKVDGEDVKFDSAHLKDLREIIDTVSSKLNDIKLVSQFGDWKVSFDITDGAQLYAKLAGMYDLNRFDIGTKGNIVTLSAIAL